MSLINCKECNHEFSSKAKACPNCGYKVKPKTHPVTKFLGIGFAIFVGLAVISLMMGNTGSSSRNKPKDNLTEGGYYGCVTEDSLSQLNSAINKEDANAVGHLTKTNQCFAIPRGLEFTNIEQGFMVSKVRIYADKNNNMELYVPVEMTR